MSGWAVAGVPALSPAERAWHDLVRGETADAARRAEQLLRAEPGNARAAFVLVEALHRSDRGPEVDARFRPLLARSSTQPAAWVALGRSALLRHQPAEAESLFRCAWNRCRDLGDAAGELVAAEQLGSAIHVAGRSKEAEPILARALELAQAQGAPMAAAFLRYEHGRAQHYTRASAAPAEELGRAILEARALDLPLWEGDAELALSIWHRGRMDLDACLEHRQAALVAYQKAGDPLRESRALRHIGVVRKLRGELTQALLTLREAEAMARRAGASGEVGLCLNDIAGVYNLVGDYDRSSRLCRDALRAVDTDGTADWRASVLANLGVNSIDQGRPAEALDFYEQALAAFQEVGDRRGESVVLVNAGRCYCLQGQTAPGIRRLERAISAAREYNIPLVGSYALLNLGLCHLIADDLAPAERAFADAGRWARETGYFKVEQAVLHGSALVARSRGDDQTALARLEEAITIAEGIRLRCADISRLQMGTFGKAMDLYATTLDLLSEMHARQPGLGYDRKAYAVVQKAKARSLLDLLAEAQVELRCRADTSYQRREAEILARVSELVRAQASAPPADSGRIDSEIADLQERLDRLEGELRRGDPRYAEFKYPSPCTLEEIQHGTVNEGELILEYFLGDSASFVWAVTPRSFASHRLPPRAAVEAKVRAILSLLHDPNILGPDAADLVSVDRELSRILLGPVQSELPLARRVIIVPHGILNYLPFEMLFGRDPGPAEESRSFGSLPYLILQSDVSYVPAAGVLTLLRRSPRPPPSAHDRPLLLAGDPVIAGPDRMSVFAQAAFPDGRPPRAFFREEIDALRSLFRLPKNELLARERATVPRLREMGRRGPHRYVHLATHGVYNERHPRCSGLLLSADPEGGDDGFLSVDEVFGLDLECDLVVLSACATALGEEVSGEGILGLTRAFLYAGSRSVVAALWEIPGRETAEFMRVFYEELIRAPGAGRTHALAEAKRWMIRRDRGRHRGDAPSSHPHFWSAFVLTGIGD